MKKQVWLINNTFVSEPFIGGVQLGEIGNGYEIPADVEVIDISQAKFDQMMEEFYKIHGYYPDQ